MVVDVTSEETGDLLRAALGTRLRRRAGQQEAARRIVGELRGADRGRRRTAGRQIKYEATVGAGLPIIDTYHKLVETGDRVLRIDGCVSGTLMYVVSAVSAGQAVLAGGARGGGARLRRTRSARRPLGRRRGAQGADPGAPDGLPRCRRPCRRTWCRARSRSCRSTSSWRACPTVDAEWGRAYDARSGARPRAALRRDGHAERRVGEAGGRAGRRARSARCRARATSWPSPRAAIAPSRWSSAAPAPEPR